jgi:hypothetical protein
MAQSPAHEVQIYAIPTVEITVDNESICLGGTIIASAWPTPTPTPENPYDYMWSVNGVEYGYNTYTIPVTNDLFVGVNEIAVTVQRAYGSISCRGSNIYLVNVVTPPSLELTQNTTGICLGGEISLEATVVNFDVNLVNIEDFSYEWKRNDNPMAGNYSSRTDIPTATGTYVYQVKANSILGCNSPWTLFEPVKVVAQPTVQIAPKDYHLYDVCEGAAIEIITILGVTDPVIQTGFQYQWNNDPWVYFTNEIDPRTIEFPQYGTYMYTLKVEFENPTCLPATSNTLTYKVAKNPAWVSYDINPDPLYEVLCLGETVTLSAEYTSELNNIGRIQWYFSYEGGAPVALTPGGNKTHKPTNIGEYNYILTFDPTDILSGCSIDAITFDGLKVNAAPTAVFDHVASTESICVHDTYLQPAELVMIFTGIPPFYFVVRDQWGVVTNGVAYQSPHSIFVTPDKTTKYTLESVDDGSNCSTAFLKSDITVTVTNVVVMNDYVEACERLVEIELDMISYVSRWATVEFLGQTHQIYIVPRGIYGYISIDLSGLAPGEIPVKITIDNCEYYVTILNNFGLNVDQLVIRRWEGYHDVLVVNNNPETNGGYSFTSYQGYKNDEIIQGATQQWYQDLSGVNGWYSVRLTGTKNGLPVTFQTCKKAFNSKTTINVYPVPADIDEPVTVQLDLTPEELEGAVLDIYDAKGAHIKHLPIVSSHTQVTGFPAQGTYFGRITTGTNEIRSIKFVIVK